MSEWYIYQNGERSGPYPWDELYSKVQRGSLDPDDLVWSTGMSDWVPANRVKELFPEKPPPIPEPPPGIQAAPAGGHFRQAHPPPFHGAAPTGHQAAAPGQAGSRLKKQSQDQAKKTTAKKGRGIKVAILSFAVVLIIVVVFFVVAAVTSPPSSGKGPLAALFQLFGDTKNSESRSESPDSQSSSGTEDLWAVPLDFKGTSYPGEIREALSESLRRDLPHPGEVPYRAYPGSFYAGRATAGVENGSVRQEITLVSLDSSSPVVSFYTDELADWALAMEIESFILWAESEGTMLDAYSGLIPAVMIYPADEWDQDYWHPEAETIIILTY